MDYSYEELVQDVHIGHEVECKYRGNLYITLNVPAGFGLGGDKQKFVYYDSPQALLEHGTIDGKKLRLFQSFDGLWKE